MSFIRVTFGFPSFSSGAVLRRRDRRRRLSIVVSAVTRRRTRNSICIPIIATLDVDRSDFSVLLSVSQRLISTLHQSFADSTPAFLFPFASLFLSILSVSLSSVSPRFTPFYRCRRIITRKSEFHFVLIERSVRCASVATFPSLDAQQRVSHDSSRVSGCSKRNVSEQFQTTRRRGDEVGNGRVALSPYRSLAKYVSTFVPCPRYNASCAVTTTRLIP